MTKYNELRDPGTILKKCGEAIKRYQAKGKAAPTAYSLTDGQGLRLDVSEKRKDGKLLARTFVWRFQYRRPSSGKNNNLTFGQLFLDPYGGITIAMARERAQETASLLQQGIDPAEVRDGARAVAEAAAKAEAEAMQRAKEGKAPLGSFQAAAEDWLDHKRGTIMDRTLDNYTDALKKFAYPYLGLLPLGDIRSKHIAPMKESLVKAGKLASLDVVLNSCFQVFEYAREHDRCEFNPVQRMNGDLKRQMVHKRAHQPRTTDPTKLGTIVRTIREQQRRVVARDLALCGLYTLQRVGALSQMAWADVQLDAGIWECPAKYMKLHRSLKESAKTPAHIVPLSRQVVAILRARKQQQEKAGITSPWVFPKARDASEPANKNSAGAMLRSLGFTGVQSMHGFRATGRTMGSARLKLDQLMLETQLAHRQKRGQLDGGLGTAYNDPEEFLREAEQITTRADVMQQWADYVDGLTTQDMKLAA